MKHRNRLPREVVDARCLETFKARLDRALSNLVWLKMSLLMAGGLDEMTFKGLFQPKLSCESVKLRLCALFCRLKRITLPAGLLACQFQSYYPKQR